MLKDIVQISTGILLLLLSFPFAIIGAIVDVFEQYWLLIKEVLKK